MTVLLLTNYNVLVDESLLLNHFMRFRKARNLIGSLKIKEKQSALYGLVSRPFVEV